MTNVRRFMALALVLVLLLAVGGCKKKAEESTLTPKVKPPVILTAGVLKAGVDLSYPPFAGKDGGQDAGIDVDVAAAIAERLGLKLELVDVKPDGMAKALNDGKIDIMLGGTPITSAVLADVASAGSYLIDAPGIFAKVSGSEVATVTPEQLFGKKVGAQEGSAAFWLAQSDLGEAGVTKYSTLRDAVNALSKGEVDYVVCDSAVGAYIARDFKDVKFVGQYADGTPLGVSVKKDATDLEAQVRTVLDGLASDGMLDTIRKKWLGDLPQLQVPPAGQSVASVAASVDIH